MSDTGNNKCPLCGKDTQKDETFCRDCQEIAHNSFSEELLDDKKSPITEFNDQVAIEPLIEKEHKEQETTNQDISEQTDRDTESFSKRNKKSLIFIGVGIFFLILVGAVGSYIRILNKNTEETEIAYWNKCIEENTPLGYSKYLVQYPEGKFSDDAYRKITELRNNERKSWEGLRNSMDIDALFSYLTDHPSTPYVREIRKAIDSLGWIKTQEDNTASAYLAYLENVKLERFNGEYQSLAQERYDYLSQLKTLEGDELNEVKKIVTDFFKALSTSNGKEIQKLATDTLNKFYASHSFLSKNIIDSLKASYKNENIKGSIFSPVTDSIEAILDNKGICFISLPIEQEITYTDRKKKKEHLQSVIHIELKNQKIQTLYTKND